MFVFIEQEASGCVSDPEIERIIQAKMHRMMTPPRTVLNADDRTFDSMLSAHQYVLADFWAEWCGPCRTMHPIFDEMCKKYDAVQFVRVNVDSSPLISTRYRVQSIPTFIMFHNGVLVDRMLGAVGAPGLHRMCKQCT